MKRKTKSNRVLGVSPASVRDWEVEDDLRTLQRAAEITKDPARLKKAQALARTKLEELASISAGAAPK